MELHQDQDEVRRPSATMSADSRFYRDAAVKLRQAIDAFNGTGNLSFIMQLGDLLDGRASWSLLSCSIVNSIATDGRNAQLDLDTLLDIFKTAHCQKVAC